MSESAKEKRASIERVKDARRVAGAKKSWRTRRANAKGAGMDTVAVPRKLLQDMVHLLTAFSLMPGIVE